MKQSLDNITNHAGLLNGALVEIRRLYLRSNKRDKHTCYQMFLVAEKALREIEQAAGTHAGEVVDQS